MGVKCVTDPRLALVRLREVMVDPARFSSETEAVSSYLEPGLSSDKLLAVVFPRSKLDIQQVLEVARGNGMSIYTPLPWGLNPPRAGLVMDFRYMADIKGIDSRNLFLEIEPGVTWEQVTRELEGRGVRVALPAAARSPYVLESAMEREVVLPACGYTNKQLSTFHAVLADGREYRSGSDALANSVAHWREDGGPNISRAFTGSRNSFGLPTRAFVFLYPEPEDRKVVVLGFESLLQACELAARAARSEVGTEVLLLSKPKAKDALGSAAAVSNWSVVFGLEGSPRQVEYQEKRLNEYVAELKLKSKPGGPKLTGAAFEALGKPWYAPEVSFGFYTNWSRVRQLSSKVESALKGSGNLAQMVIPVKRGASVYVQYDVQEPSGAASEKVKKLLPVICDAGAFFPNPTGSLAAHIFSRQPAYLKLLKQVSLLLDPDDMLNSGQVVEV